MFKSLLLVYFAKLRALFVTFFPHTILTESADLVSLCLAVLGGLYVEGVEATLDALVLVLQSQRTPKQ